MGCEYVHPILLIIYLPINIKKYNYLENINIFIFSNIILLYIYLFVIFLLIYRNIVNKRKIYAIVKWGKYTKYVII